MESSLYTGRVVHERLRPVRNRFVYGAYFLYVDLAELDDLDRRLRFFGHNRGTLATLDDGDHGPRDGSPLRPWIDGLLGRAGVDLAGGPVRLLSFPRLGRLRFYPVSFWYCFHADGTLRAVLAEVSNTFHEHHNYLLHRQGDVLPWDTEVEAGKMFHVSPFMPMDARYVFTFAEPGRRLRVRVVDMWPEDPLLLAAVDLRRRSLTDGSLVAAVARYGPMPPRAWLLIRLQALNLLRQGVKYQRKPTPPAEETSL
jgi:DUF1365 family protein